MVDQVLWLHPDSKWFHIGADEVNSTVYSTMPHRKRTNKTKATRYFISCYHDIIIHLNPRYGEFQ